MKNFLCLFVALAIILGSCSHDDSNEPDNGNNVTLPKKIQYTNPDYPDRNFTSAIKYVGNRIVSFTTEKTRTDYTYQGNLIVKITTYDIRYNKNDKLVEDSYSYTGGKLSSWTSAENFTSEYPFGEYRSKSVYTYNADDTITKEKYQINTTTGEETKSNYFDVFTYKNGNLITLVSTDTNSLPYSVNTSIYEYDTKKQSI
ncbi:MAG: hypothetical protein EOO44_18230 [Flavobacterium sp.]|nr:MAG: hypothetical protein EOO44_18230 [Flavobacterium sp.]